MEFKYRILAFIFAILAIHHLNAQEEKKIIEIRQAGGSKQDQANFPGANILFKNSEKRVHLFHEGELIE